jgi:hypothetical protein
VTTIDAPHFVIGDQVRIRNNPHSLWTVVAHDTNRTPVRDPEPAYQLEHRTREHSVIRYAYESDLELAES